MIISGCLALSSLKLQGWLMGKLGVKEFIQSASRVMHVAHKPTRDEIWMLVKVCVFGIGAIGGVGFMVKIIFWLVESMGFLGG